MKFLILFFTACILSAGSALFAKESTKIERTFGMIKPDAVQGNKVGHILARIEEQGFQIAGMKMVTLTKEQASEFYAVHRDRPFFDELVNQISSSPVVVFVIEGKDAVESYRKLMGATDPMKASPGTLRGDFGLSLSKNAVHGSDSFDNAIKEIAFIFSGEEIYSRTK